MTQPPPGYTIRLVQRRSASPKPGMSQEWDEWQVRQGRRVVARTDTLAQAAEAAAAIDTRPAGGERDPVTRCIDVLRLDHEEVMEGHRDAHVEPDVPPGPNRSRTYWHGWRNVRPESTGPSPGVPLVRDCRAVLGEDFLTILGGRSRR
jgi:hypothetical protein